MSTRIFDNDGKSVLVAKESVYPDSWVAPWVIKFTDPAFSKTTSPLCHFFMGEFRLKRSANADVSTTLDNMVFYTSFGPLPIPLSIGGVVMVPTATNVSGYPTATTATKQFNDFITDHLAAQAIITGTDTVTITLERDTQLRCLLTSSELTYQRRRSPAIIFTFRMDLLVLQITDLSSTTPDPTSPSPEPVPTPTH